jgi:hypothetical protein
LFVVGEVAIIRYVGEALFQYFAGKRLDLGKADWSPAKAMPSNGCSFDAGTY